MDSKTLDIMIMKLFSLKGKTGTNKFDVATWRDCLKGFDKEAIKRAFNNCLQKDGFFEIKMVLDELIQPNELIAEREWAAIVKVANDGGHGFERINQETRTALQLAGGLQKLRHSGNDFTLREMKKTFLKHIRFIHPSRKLIE